MDNQIEIYVAKKKDKLLKHIQQETIYLRSMKSQLGKLQLNISYGKEYIKDAENGIEMKEHMIDALKVQYNKTPIWATIEQIYTVIVNEDMNNKIYTSKLEEKYLTKKFEEKVVRMINGIEEIEIRDEIVIKGNYSVLGNKTSYEHNRNIKLPVDGYLLYELTGHSGEYCIYSKDSLRQIEQDILSIRGINNMFTTEMLVLFNGKIKRYYITNKKGTILTKEQIERMSLKTVSKLNIVWED